MSKALSCCESEAAPIVLILLALPLQWNHPLCHISRHSIKYDNLSRGPQLSIIPYEISKSSDFGIDSKISRRFQRDSKISQRFPARF